MLLGNYQTQFRRYQTHLITIHTHYLSKPSYEDWKIMSLSPLGLDSH